MLGIHEMLAAEKGAKNPLQTASTLQPSPGSEQVGLDLTEGILENNRMTKPRSWVDVAVSVCAHTAILAALILVPLFYTHAIELPKLRTAVLVAPLPPAPPPAPAVAAAHAPVPHKQVFKKDDFYVPKAIPKVIPQIDDQQEAQAQPEALEGVVGGIPGGVPGGVVGGMGNGPVAKIARPEAPKRPIRVGGDVREPQLLKRVEPEYPPLAKQARVQGDVVIDCVINQQGTVTQMKVMSGQPLLIQAAMNAIAQWKYQPTTLNGQPIAVEMNVTVHFQLQ